MPPDAQDRPIDALREETIDRLIVNYGHGRLSQAALERRLDAALDTQDPAALAELTRDLDPSIDPAYLQKKREQQPPGAAPPARGEVKYLVSVFGGAKRSGQWVVPEELRVVNLFSGTRIDLSSAQFTDRRVRIRLLCLFGGVDIFVPDEASVTVEAFCIFGGIGDRSRGSRDPQAVQVVVDGLVMFGGAEIKVRKGVRQRLLELAEGTRRMFAPGPERGARP